MLTEEAPSYAGWSTIRYAAMPSFALRIDSVEPHVGDVAGAIPRGVIDRRGTFSGGWVDSHGCDRKAAVVSGLDERSERSDFARLLVDGPRLMHGVACRVLGGSDCAMAVEHVRMVGARDCGFDIDTG